MFVFDCDLDFSGEVHTTLLHIVQFAVIVTLCICVLLCVFMCVCVFVHACTYMSVPGSLGFTTVPVIFSEVMTSAEKWVAFQEGWPIIVGYFYWSKRVLKIQMIVFLWWSRSMLVFFEFCRNYSSGGHRVVVLSLDGRQMGRLGLWFCSGISCF